jgi:hypothetical protein
VRSALQAAPPSATPANPRVSTALDASVGGDGRLAVRGGRTGQRRPQCPQKENIEATRAVELAGSYRRRWHRHFAQHRKQRDRRLAVAPLHVYRRRADNKTGRGGQSNIPARENSPGTLQLYPTNRQSEAGHLSLQIDILASLAVHRVRAAPKNEKPTFETSRAERAARIFGQIPSRRSPDPPWPPPRRQESDRHPELTGPNQITPVGAENRRSIGGLPMCRRHLSRTRRIITCQ